MDTLLGIGIFIVLWWLSFFAMLPLGAKSAHEADAVTEPGVERGAPLAHRLPFKAALAAGIAAILWLGVLWAVHSPWVLNAFLPER